MGIRSYAFLGCITLLTISGSFAADVFTLNGSLAGTHPRILFTQSEADARYLEVKDNADWTHNTGEVAKFSYPSLDASGFEMQGQRFWWRFSRLAITAALSRDASYITQAKTWFDQMTAEDWQYEHDATVSLGGAHLIAAYALAYDCLYNDLSASQKSDGEALIRGAIDSLQHRGFDVADYWTYDYQNNHMHFRLCAYLYCILAVYEPGGDLQADADRAATFFRRLEYALAPDGSDHEGLNYMQYSAQMLYPALYALKRCTDSDPTGSPHFHRAGYNHLYHVTPGYTSGFGFGDSPNQAASAPEYLYWIAAEKQDGYLQYFTEQLETKNGNDFWRTHWKILFKDYDLAGQNISVLPLHRYFDDFGIAICRSSWSSSATAVAFKCGPYGGRRHMSILGTEYNPHIYDGGTGEPWVAVAHDDPDAGTFLIYSNGQFLSTGDDYEKTAKVTTQHSTFIIDDATQYGGGGAWSQPPGLDKLSWNKDYFDTGEDVIFTGDMTDAYADMSRLERTFVSRQARYFIIFDDAVSATSDRTFEWRLQTEGTLADQGSGTYKITNGSASALAKLYTPSAAAWSTTTNKIGNILRARLTGQQQNRFMVLVWPGASGFSDVTASYTSGDVLGLAVANGDDTEYTLQSTTPTAAVTSGDFAFNGHVLSATVSGGALKNAALTNGTSLTYKSGLQIATDVRASFSLDETETGGRLCRVGPASGSGTATDVTVTLGGLNASTQYPVLVDYTDQQQKTTDGSGQLTVTVNLDQIHVIGIGTLAGIRLQPSLTAAARDAIRIIRLDNGIQVHLSGLPPAAVKITDMTGCAVRTLAPMVTTDGFTATWDGKNALGYPAAPGMYLAAVGGQMVRLMLLP